MLEIAAVGVAGVVGGYICGAYAGAKRALARRKETSDKVQALLEEARRKHEEQAKVEREADYAKKLEALDIEHEEESKAEWEAFEAAKLRQDESDAKFDAKGNRHGAHGRFARKVKTD